MNKGTKFVLKATALFLVIIVPAVTILIGALFPEQTPVGTALAVFLGLVYSIGLDTGYGQGRRDALKEQKEEDTPEEEHK